ncbi:lipopolysaccharide transport system permease protein [Pseudomonas pohangensis]|uniref:Lipopolysaccharide transport system permease protein n=1 Tax=Pseudomonas pohangensis TaxID=364197 RepID=A0A1H2EF91_9PSED|nr:ABC transporter permease [Pseudomonas pohangensis]SDT93806.1 lipopolysaccharide transport system permease protein [Pseudomonas pohangensis]
MLFPVFGSSLLNDLKDTWRYSRAILFMTLSDLRGRYRRSVLGPLWLTLGTSIGALGMSYIWSELMHKDVYTFIPTLTAGLILWQFISGIISESPALFVRQASLIRNLSLPLSIYPLQLLLRHLLNLLHYAPVYLLISLFLQLPVTASTLLVIPGLILVSLNLLWMSLLVGLLGARFRDLEYLVTSSMPVLMLLSPVFYKPSFLPFSESVIWLNPVSHLIEIIREPLLGAPAPAFVVYTNLGMLLAGSALTLWLYQRKRQRLAFWI